MNRERILGPPDHDGTVGTLKELAHLSASVSHHLINDLCCIVSNAEFLQLKLEHGKATREDREILQAIIQSAIQTAGVARRLLDVTTPITASGESMVDVSELIERFVSARSGPTHAMIRWVLRLSEVPPIRGAVDELRLMFEHLCANAQEASSPERCTIRLSTSVDSRGWILIEIQDEGEGMTPEVQAHSMEPFYTTKSGRLGVGLNLANAIWRRHGGSFAIDSGVGKGTTIRLSVEPTGRSEVRR